MRRLTEWLRRDPGVHRDDGRGDDDPPRPDSPSRPDIPANAGISGRARGDALVYQAAALVLAYPEAALLDRLDVIESALSGTTDEPLFAPVLAHLRGDSLRELQSFHVQEFDLSRRHALHLSYWTDGDTRRRGNVLAEIKQVYRDSGLVVDTGGELPDYLPMVLEFAVHDPERGAELLQQWRPSLELLRIGLEEDDLPHAGVLTGDLRRRCPASPAQPRRGAGPRPGRRRRSSWSAWISSR